MTEAMREYLREIGSRGGSKRSPAQKKAARQNWKKAVQVIKQVNKGKAA